MQLSGIDAAALVSAASCLSCPVNLPAAFLPRTGADSSLSAAAVLPTRSSGSIAAFVPRDRLKRFPHGIGDRCGNRCHEPAAHANLRKARDEDRHADECPPARGKPDCHCEDGVLEELYVERNSLENYVGNIYKGRIVNLEPSIQAAFVDFGVGRNGFLHVSDVEYQYYKHLVDGRDDEDDEDDDDEDDAPRSRQHRGRQRVNERSARNKPPIQQIFKRGSEVLVQVIKEGIGAKGRRCRRTSAIPGRYLRLMPGLQRVGVSRKIADDSVRRKLRQALVELNPPPGLGFIIRTAGIDRSQADLQRDLNYLFAVVERHRPPAEKISGAGRHLRRKRHDHPDHPGHLHGRHRFRLDR